ncbi:hypothetical protein J4421_05030 [Candidatus Woesearchaeota archaeon]|nr:hypothetical protein [Candidatus Woesearchaeota archaeon]
MMGLTDKLTALDQYIWKGYKKATQYANNALGWNKFDLARKSLTGIDVSAIGFWSYDLMLGFKTDSIADLIASLGSAVAATGLTMVGTYSYRKELGQREIIETRLAENWVIVPPRLKPWRPLELCSSVLFAGLGMYSLTNKLEIPKGMQISTEEWSAVMGLTMLSIASMGGFYTSTSYFSDQLMAPPKQKKKILSTAVNYLRNKLTPAAQPQKDPAKLFIDETIN